MRAAALGGGAALCAALALASCAKKERALWQAGIPGWRTAATVTAAVPRERYLDVALASEAFELRLLFPGDETCRALLEPGAQLEYVQDSPLGTAVRGDARCPVVGVASLVEWRDRRPRPPGQHPVPRAQATFEPLYADESVALVRGRFPLAGLIDWPGSGDTVAMIPNTVECRPRLAGGVASMEYRPMGNVPFALVTGEGLCPILGFARPLPEGPPEPEVAAPPP